MEYQQHRLLLVLFAFVTHATLQGSLVTASETGLRLYLEPAAEFLLVALPLSLLRG